MVLDIMKYSEREREREGEGEGEREREKAREWHPPAIIPKGLSYPIAIDKNTSRQPFLNNTSILYLHNNKLTDFNISEHLVSSNILRFVHHMMCYIINKVRGKDLL